MTLRQRTEWFRGSKPGSVSDDSWNQTVDVVRESWLKRGFFDDAGKAVVPDTAAKAPVTKAPAEAPVDQPPPARVAPTEAQPEPSKPPATEVPGDEVLGTEADEIASVIDDLIPSKSVDVEALERTALGGTKSQRAKRVDQLMDTEWNHKVAASNFLETGEIPETITSKTARDAIERAASVQKQQFTDQMMSSDIGILTRLSEKGRLPKWQKDILDESLKVRTRASELPVEKFGKLTEPEQAQLKSFGWEHVPQTHEELRGIQSSLLALDKIETVPALTRWLNRNTEVVGNAQKWVSRNPPSPYWESGRLNIPGVKAAIRAQYPDQRVVDGTKQTIGDALKINKSDPLGPCA